MKIEQLYTGCLAQGAYYITSEGEAAIIDPLRETHTYVERLKRDNVKLKYIFETHFHADFVSGHLDLSKNTGAAIVYGPNANPAFDAIIAHDGQIFNIGQIKIKVIHTPGHTLESVCYLLLDENDKPHALFSGDTLFLGDVGRPDLAQKTAHITKEELAALLYESLYHKILPLPDDVIVYPGHGAGSACGKNMMKETVDTLANQKKLNYALNQPNKEAFIEAVLKGLLPPPAYFEMNVAMNKKGYESFENVLNKSMKKLSLDQFINLAQTSGALLLDTRHHDEFAQAFIPKSINIGLNGDFAPWAGTLIADVNQPILIITDPGKEEEVITRLSRVGFDNVLGYLEGGFSSWVNAGLQTDAIQRVSASAFADEMSKQKNTVIDVRKPSEYDAEHVEGAVNKPLAYINEWINTLDRKEHFYLHCAGGYRSAIAASILLARGYRNFTEVQGGFNAISQTTVKKTNYVCVSAK
ncbi:MAG: MBL fold metallo-hydrolase [Cytophagaceae bacterium]|nr:MBL fold metallo-hydrolase [Cytophagaceae bacterium]MDW8456111.1 MBL fold metallo-hydrolase [Cytophagaceae bacterium]